MSLCGDCLHAKEAHTEHNGHFMYCACCHKLCDKDEFNKVHSPTNIETIMSIGARKQ